jgi:hypothetical protein
MYDYDSIMHYSSKAFSRAPEDDNIMTIEPVSTDRTSIEGLGRKRNLSDVDVVKIKKLYKCAPYENWYTACIFIHMRRVGPYAHVLVCID